MTTKAVCAMLAMAVAPAAVAVEETEKPAPPVNLRLQVVFSKYQGDKKIGSLPYALSLPANGKPSRLRMGVKVPIRGTSADGTVSYQTLGTNVDCRATPAEGGRFWVTCTFQQSSVYPNGGNAGESGTPADAALRPPPFRDFSADAALLLGDGQTAQHTAATDPLSGEALRVDMTLTVVK